MSDRLTDCAAPRADTARLKSFDRTTRPPLFVLVNGLGRHHFDPLSGAISPLKKNGSVSCLAPLSSDDHFASVFPFGHRRAVHVPHLIRHGFSSDPSRRQTQAPVLPLLPSYDRHVGEDPPEPGRDLTNWNTRAVQARWLR